MWRGKVFRLRDRLDVELGAQVNKFRLLGLLLSGDPDGVGSSEEARAGLTEMFWDLTRSFDQINSQVDKLYKQQQAAGSPWEAEHVLSFLGECQALLDNNLRVQIGKMGLLQLMLNSSSPVLFVNHSQAEQITLGLWEMLNDLIGVFDEIMSLVAQLIEEAKQTTASPGLVEAAA